MTMQTQEASPLQLLREMRDQSLATVARAAGLTVGQAEALERGDEDGFASTAELIAASVAYANALDLDAEDAADMLHETAAEPGSAVPFERFQRGVDLEATGELPVVPTYNASTDYSGFAEGGLSGAVRAARELDSGYAHAIDVTTSELEMWENEPQMETLYAPPLHTQQSNIGSSGFRQTVMRVRNDERVRETLTRIDAGIRNVRGRMESSQYGTLIAGVVVGVLAFLILMGISSLGGDKVNGLPTTEPATKAAATDAKASAESADAKADPAKPKAIIPRNKLTIDVLNTGSIPLEAQKRADALVPKGYKIREVGNSSTIYPEQVVLYAPGLRREAERLGKDAGITTLDQLDTLRGGRVQLIAVIR